MPGLLPYEPSVQSIFGQALPAGARLLVTGDGMRNRASWVLAMRATGLGRIEGGEIVVVAAPRVPEITGRMADLQRLGIVALVLEGDVSDSQLGLLEDACIPAVCVPEGTNLGELHQAIERFIGRRRRELFTLDQALHRRLVEAAIAGGSIQDLVHEAHLVAEKQVVLDRGSELFVAPVAPDKSDTSVDAVVRKARMTIARQRSGRVVESGPPSFVAMPVMSGKSLLGLALILGGTHDSLDEDEAIVTSLASACAIAMAREPVVSPPSLDSVLSEIEAASAGLAPPNHTWTAVSVQSIPQDDASVWRAVSDELQARGSRHVVGVTSSSVVAVIESPESFPWDSFVASIAARVPRIQLVCGLGRAQQGAVGARRSSAQALEAVQRSNGSPLTRFDTVELQALLASVPGASDFVDRRLAPLFSGGAPELVDTAFVYLDSGRNAREASRRLDVHRNTLLYRLARIRDLLSIDWDDASAVFEIELALRIRQALTQDPNADPGTG